MQEIKEAANSKQVGQIVEVEYENILRDENYSEGIKHLPINRPRSKSHVDELAKDMAKNGFTSTITVFKNVKGSKTYVSGLAERAHYIVDGSHRYDAAEQAKVSIKYALVPEKTIIQSIEDISKVLIGLNTKSKSWTVNDYINHYAGEIFTNTTHQYTLLKGLTKEYAGNVQMRTIASVLATGNTKGANSSGISSQIKEGKFTINFDEEKSRKLLEEANQVIKGLNLNATTKRDFSIFVIDHILSRGSNFSVTKCQEHIKNNFQSISAICSQTTQNREIELHKLFNNY